MPAEKHSPAPHGAPLAASDSPAGGSQASVHAGWRPARPAACQLALPPPGDAEYPPTGFHTQLWKRICWRPLSASPTDTDTAGCAAIPLLPGPAAAPMLLPPGHAAHRGALLMVGSTLFAHYGDCWEKQLEFLSLCCQYCIITSVWCCHVF